MGYFWGMGLRGPAPGSGRSFRGQPVIVDGGFPAVRWRGPQKHPLERSGKIAIHRLIASEMLGRVLTRRDHVRFRDGDVWNWSPANLEVVGASAPLLDFAAKAARRRRKK